MISLALFLNIIMVDIKGEVENPGVYGATHGTINDIVNMAGGFTIYADTEFINLARGITDEMVIYIPHIKNRHQIESICDCQPIICPPRISTTTVVTTTIPKTTTTTTQKINIVNINTANLSELITLRGIGEAIAERIIAFREATPFITIEDILKVNGIGEVIFAQIKDFITI